MLYDFSLKLTRFYQRVTLTPDTILQLRRNDPELKDLRVSFARHSPNHDFDALRGVDWEKEGDCISNNSHLETLSISASDGAPLVIFQNAAAFFEAVARNTSITTFEYWGCDYIGLMFKSLAPRFGNGLRTLELNNATHIETSDIRLFISALEKCGSLGSTLEQIEICCCMIIGDDLSGDELPGQLIDAFDDYCSLIKLNWTGDHIGLGNVSIQALARLLNNPNCVLEDLDLGDSCNSSEGDTFDSAVLANALALASNKKLKRLDLTGNDWFGENESTQTITKFKLCTRGSLFEGSHECAEYVVWCIVEQYISEGN